MHVTFHQEVFSDLGKIMEYYEREATDEVAAEFYSEFEVSLISASKRPESFAIREGVLRRVERLPKVISGSCPRAQERTHAPGGKDF